MYTKHCCILTQPSLAPTGVGLDIIEYKCKPHLFINEHYSFNPLLNTQLNKTDTMNNINVDHTST